MRLEPLIAKKFEMKGSEKSRQSLLDVLEMGFGMIIKKIRSQLKMTQEQFARELDISFSTINRWENGHTVPSKLAKVRLLEFCKNQNVDINLISELEKL